MQACWYLAPRCAPNSRCIANNSEAEPSGPALLLCVFTFPSACSQTVRTQTKMSSRPSAPKVCRLHNKGLAKPSSHARTFPSSQSCSVLNGAESGSSFTPHICRLSADAFPHRRQRAVVVHKGREVKTGEVIVCLLDNPYLGKLETSTR